MSILVNEITDKIINNTTGIFDDIYREYLNIFICKLDKNITNFEKTNGKIIVDKANILFSLGVSFKKYLINISSRTLISELNEIKEYLYGKTSMERYNYFVEWFLNNRYEIIFNKNSLLNTAIISKLDKVLISIDEVLLRLEKDLPDIERIFSCQINKITDININCGDSHNNGKTVAIITFNKSFRIVYKPHSLITDIILGEIINYFNERKLLKSNLRQMNIINKDTYGWQEYISTDECMNIYMVNNCMYRLGCLIFISYITNLTDLHFENIYISGEYPYIIDTETMNYNYDLMQGIYRSKLNLWDKFLQESIFLSGLFPNYLSEATGSRSSDFSALNCKKNNLYREYLGIINAGTDEIRFGTKRKVIDATNNNVKLNGDIVNVEDYVDKVCEGFHDCYKLILKYKDDYLKFINKIPLEDGCYRQVLRRTDLYLKCLNTAYHPTHLNSYNNWRNVFSKLKSQKNNFQLYDILVNSETEQLLNQDIPYFYAKYRSLDLFTFNGYRINNFYNETIEDQLNKRINKLSQNDLSIQTYLIKCLLSEKKHINSDNKRFSLPDKLFFDNNNANTILILTKWIADYIESNHTFELKNDSRKLYFNIIEYGNCKLGMVQQTLYDGVGIALFYMQMYHTHKDKIYYDIAIKLSKEIGDIDSEIYLQENDKYGAFDGISSLLFLNYNAWRTFQNKIFLDRYNKILEILLSKNLELYESYDIISGCSGIISMTLNIYKNDKTQISALSLAEKLGERLNDLFSTIKKSNLIGFAHGYSGIAASFMQLYFYLKNDNYYNNSINLLLIENNYYDKLNNIWKNTSNISSKISSWCYGTVGILAGRLAMFEYAKKEHKELIHMDIVRCLESINSFGYEKDSPNILCHGNAGTIDLLISYYKKTNDIKCKILIDKFITEMLKNLKEYGIKYTNSAGVINISFMSGISGLGYSLLRYIDPNIPSVLLLESINQ